MSSIQPSKRPLSPTTTKRILTELSQFSSSPASSHPYILALAATPSSLLQLSAILSGSPLPAYTGYHPGRWLVSITLPPTYPNLPPIITFKTKICHPNINFDTGEVCLDLLKENWTPLLGVVGALESIGRLLQEPGTDSPLNVDVSNLVRNGDGIGARSLVGWYTGEERFEGTLDDGEAKGKEGR